MQERPIDDMSDFEERRSVSSPVIISQSFIELVSWQHGLHKPPQSFFPRSKTGSLEGSV